MQSIELLLKQNDPWRWIWRQTTYAKTGAGFGAGAVGIAYPCGPEQVPYLFAYSVKHWEKCLG